MKWRDDGGRGDLNERQWQKLQPLLPPQKAHTGSASLRSPPYYQWYSVATSNRCTPGEIFQSAMANIVQLRARFYRWRSEGLWQRMWESLMQQADTEGNIDWEVSFVDSTIVRAHQHAAGAKGGSQKPRLPDVELVALALRYT